VTFFPCPLLAMRLCRRGKSAVFPAKPVPACIKQGAGIQVIEFVNVYTGLDPRIRGHDELRHSVDAGVGREAPISSLDRWDFFPWRITKQNLE
jgi:hypothetical protein